MKIHARPGVRIVVYLLGAAVCAAAAGLPVTPQAGTAPPPTGLWAAQTSPREITLVWMRVAGAMRYRIYEATTGELRLVGQTMASGEQYVRPVSAFGVAHRFAIEATFENGEVSAQAPFNPVVPQEAAPGLTTMPAHVQVTPRAVGTLSVSWDAVPGATAYRIARQVVPGGFKTLCRLCPTTTTYVDDTATPGARHIYTVAAISPSGASRPGRSNEVVATGDSAATASQRQAGASAGEVRPTPSDTGRAAAAPKGSVHNAPTAGSCLSLGEQGNVVVRLADGSVRFFERVRYERGMHIVEKPAFRPVAGITNAVAVATSGRHSLVLTADGTIRAWGRNDRGQLGIDPALDPQAASAHYIEAPVPVRGITTAVAVAAGAEHSVALLADGTIRVWGSGDRGIPGDGRADVTTNRLAPATVAGISNAIHIAAGALTTFGLLSDGTVRGWGSNWGGLGFFGVLGTGERRPHSATPLAVPGISNAIAITTSGASSLALLADGQVMAWGAARAGLRGQSASFLTTSRPLPVPGIRKAVAVSPHLILLDDGTVRELTDPQEKVAGLANAVAIASDPTNRYALLDDGRLVGWGLKQWWPNGIVTVAELGPETARECAASRRR